jgi:hypothetical protein
MHCTSCDQDVRAIVTLDPGRGKLWQCPSPSCGAVIGPYEEPGIVTGPDGDEIDLATVQPMASAPALPVVPPIKAGAYAGTSTAGPSSSRSPAPVVPQQAPTADEIEQMAIDRLAAVEAQLTQLLPERDKLQAMLSALAPASQERATG